MPFVARDEDSAVSGLVAFWGFGQTGPWGNKVSGADTGQIHNQIEPEVNHIHRLRFITGGPSEVIRGAVPRARMVTASEASDATLVPGDSGADGTDPVVGAETAILDGQALLVPPGPHRMHLKADFRTEYQETTVCGYEIKSGTDDYLIHQNASRPSEHYELLRTEGPPYHVSTVVNIDFIVDYGEDQLLTFLFGLVRSPSSEFFHRYVLYLERLS